MATERRAEFRTIDLTLDLDDATAVVESALEGLGATAGAEGLMVRSSDGMLVAVLRADDGSADEPGSTLSYRTAPTVALATRKAETLRRALGPYER